VRARARARACVCVYGPYEIKLKHYEIKYWLINLY